MKYCNVTPRLVSIFLSGAFLTLCAWGSAHAVDVDAAKALARQNNCFKCHAVDKAGFTEQELAWLEHA